MVDETNAADVATSPTITSFIRGERILTTFGDPDSTAYAQLRAAQANAASEVEIALWRDAVQDACARLSLLETLPTVMGEHVQKFFEAMPTAIRPESWGRFVMAGSKKDRSEWAKSIHPWVVNPLIGGTFGVRVKHVVQR